MSYNWSLHCITLGHLGSKELYMTIRIERETHRLKTMIRLSGRLQSKHLDALRTQLEGAQSRIVLDLNGVTLVDEIGRASCRERV